MKRPLSFFSSQKSLSQDERLLLCATKTEKTKLNPFSISVILSEDVGPKKSSAAGGVDKQLSTVENGGGRLIFTISVSQAANLMMSPVERSTMIRPGTCV